MFGGTASSAPHNHRHAFSDVTAMLSLPMRASVSATFAGSQSEPLDYDDRTTLCRRSDVMPHGSCRIAVYGTDERM
jgi:hypothetical protein